MISKKRSLRGTNPRAVLSDVLPYELPITFDNTGFYELLSRLKVRVPRKGALQSKWLGPATPALVELIFGPHQNGAQDGSDPSRYNFEPTKDYAVALSFSIGNATGSSRQVSLPHPRIQFDMDQFYTNHSESIRYFTNRSNFSIRHPHEVARYSVTKDFNFAELQSSVTTGVEEANLEYHVVRSYFTYSTHSHIYKFYSSAEFRALERKYGYLSKADVTRCFDSIYTHSISWVTNGYETTKNNTSATKTTFGGQFDKLMQRANFNETNGILIGPEISRIFAEIILQEVDVRVERALSVKRLIFGRDYEIRRFVDDYFVFVRRPEHRDVIIESIALELVPFKLHLNAAKRTDEQTPLRSSLTVAKHQILCNFNDHLRLQPGVSPGDPDRLPSISAQTLVLDYKSALLATQLKHSEIANYALARLEVTFERALSAAVKSKQSAHPAWSQSATDYWSRAARFILSVVDTSVFLFAGAETVSHSVKLARILTTALRYMEAEQMPPLFAMQVKSRIAMEMASQIRRHAGQGGPTPTHSLVLLDCLTSMGREFSFSCGDLGQILGLDAPSESGSVNAIGILTALRHCGASVELAPVRIHLEQLAVEIVGKTNATLDANSALLVSGLLGSPFAGPATARRILVAAGIDDTHLGELRRLMSGVQFRWTVDNYYQALQDKRSNEVY